MNSLYKSRTKAVIFALLAGPIGLMYVSVIGGLLLLVAIVMTAPTIFGPVGLWILCIALADQFAHNHNKKVDAMRR